MSLQNITFDTRDEYNRAQTADGIKKLLSNETLNISRLLINGEWGEGKTEFCHKLLNHFGEDYHLVYIDAFASDSVDNPLLTITAEIAKLIPKGKTRARFVKKAIPACKVGFKTAGKAAVSWAFKQSTDSISDDFEKELQKGAEQLSDLAVEGALKEQIEAEKSISSLCAALKLLTEGDNGKPLIICIDEFDRCRPPYAISMLETVKHAFDQEKVNFIFCANKEILEQSIKHHYGVENSTRYLDKFMDFSIELPRAQQGTSGREYEFNRVSISHLKIELEHYNLTSLIPLFTMRGTTPPLFLEMLERVPTFTLRDAEKLARNIAVYSAISEISWGEDLHSYISMMGIVAYTFYKTEFENLEKSEYSGDLISKHFFGYSHQSSLEADRSIRACVFAIVMFGAKHIPSTFSKPALLATTQNGIGGYQLFTEDELLHWAAKFPRVYNTMLNLA
ncbi:TPA: P-loop NTPase fold protein [Vibrio alginolyticus]